MSDGAQWYVVHTYSGYENTVKATIEKYVENRGLQDLIHEISIPLEGTNQKSGLKSLKARDKPTVHTIVRTSRSFLPEPAGRQRL